MKTDPAINGHAGNPLVKLRRLLAHHEHAADAIRTTLALLDGADTRTKADRAATVLATAMTLDRTRAARPAKAAKAASYNTQTAIATRRQKTAAFLKRFHRTKTRTVDDPQAHGVGPLIAAGYLVKKDEGYIRTAKAFAAEKTRTAPAAKYSQRKRQQRQTTAGILARYSLTDPQPSVGHRTGSLVRRGYLARRGDGYIRTEKAFTV